MINHAELIEKWLKVGAVFFISSFIWSPSRDGIEGAYALFFLLPLLFLSFKNNILTHIPQDNLIKTIFVFGFYSMIASLWNTPADIYFFLLQFFILMTWILGVYWLILNGKIDLRQILLVLIYMGSVASLVTVINFYYQNSYQGVYHFEIRLTCWCSAQSANLVGGLYGVLAIISYAFFLSCETNKERVKFGLISTVLMLPLVFSQSRGALVAFLFVLLMAIFIIKPKLWLIVLQAIVAAPVFILFIVINYSNIKSLWIERTQTFGQRDAIWSYVSQQLPEKFLAGIGMSQNTKIYMGGDNIFHHAHNTWLDTFLRTGFIGFLLIVGITYILVRKAIKLKSFEGKVLLLWLSFGLITLTFDHRILFWQIDTKWFFYWVPAAFIISLYKRQTSLNNF